MESIQETINSYKESISTVYTRIDELTEAIKNSGGDYLVKNKPLVRRRFLLYSQAYDMRESVLAMESYLCKTKARALPSIVIAKITFTALEHKNTV